MSKPEGRIERLVATFSEPPRNPCECGHGQGNHGWGRIAGIWERTPEGDTRCCLCRCREFVREEVNPDA